MKRPRAESTFNGQGVKKPTFETCIGFESFSKATIPF